MRVLAKLQVSLLRPFFGNHPRARQLEAVSELLERNPEIASLAQDDLTRGKRTDTGRKGMNGDQVVRLLLVKQLHSLSYRELEFHLQDSTAFRCFVSAPSRRPWKWTTLQSNIKRLQHKTLEQINRLLIRWACVAGIESGKKIRTDCTSVQSNIHKPTDSSLLWDGVRVLTRLLHRARTAVPSASIHFSDHTRRARRRLQAITFPAKGKKRKRHLRENYQDLLKVSRKTCSYVRSALRQLKENSVDAAEQKSATALASELSSYLTTMERVIEQTRRRVIRGESVPATEKVLSLFETHTDVIVKGERDLVFGHKVCLTSGASSLITDSFVEPGNPSDSNLVKPVLERQVAIYGKPPRQASFDGGFASKDNLRVAKDQLKVEDVAFHKKCGLEIADMVRSPWVYRQLRNFRAGIEGLISALKSAGMDRCTWRSQHSLESFRSYIWACVLAFNVSVIARHLCADTA
jgi:IS5 family transposase